MKSKSRGDLCKRCGDICNFAQLNFLRNLFSAFGLATNTEYIRLKIDPKSNKGARLIFTQMDRHTILNIFRHRFVRYQVGW